MQAYQKTIEEVLNELGSSLFGLTDKEVDEKLIRYGNGFNGCCVEGYYF